MRIVYFKSHEVQQCYEDFARTLWSRSFLSSSVRSCDATWVSAVINKNFHSDICSLFVWRSSCTTGTSFQYYSSFHFNCEHVRVTILYSLLLSSTDPSQIIYQASRLQLRRLLEWFYCSNAKNVYFDNKFLKNFKERPCGDIYKDISPTPYPSVRFLSGLITRCVTTIIILSLFAQDKPSHFCHFGLTDYAIYQQVGPFSVRHWRTPCYGSFHSIQYIARVHLIAGSQDRETVQATAH